MRNSKLIEEKKRRNIGRIKNLTPAERLQAQVQLNINIKELFFAGLRSKGFSEAEIIRIWKEK